jgi:hypothetical protein
VDQKGSTYGAGYVTTLYECGHYNKFIPDSQWIKKDLLMEQDMLQHFMSVDTIISL